MSEASAAPVEPHHRGNRNGLVTTDHGREFRDGRLVEHVDQPPADPWGRIGWVIATGPDADAVARTLADARARIT